MPYLRILVGRTNREQTRDGIESERRRIRTELNSIKGAHIPVFRFAQITREVYLSMPLEHEDTEIRATSTVQMAVEGNTRHTDSE